MSQASSQSAQGMLAAVLYTHAQAHEFQASTPNPALLGTLLHPDGEDPGGPFS